MKSALRFHGVVARDVRGACADYVRAHAPDRAALRAAVDALYATDWFDLHSAAIGVLERARRQIAPDDAAWLIGLVRKSACWAHVDWIATKILPRTAPTAQKLRAWARDDDFWVRRAALLAMLGDLRAGGGDFELFASLAAPMLGEKEFFIRKAIGWILRDVSRKRPALTVAFVRAHADEMSGLTYREATRNLPPALRRSLPRRA